LKSDAHCVGICRSRRQHPNLNLIRAIWKYPLLYLYLMVLIIRMTHAALVSIVSERSIRISALFALVNVSCCTLCLIFLAKERKGKRSMYSIEKNGARCFGISRFQKQHPNLNIIHASQLVPLHFVSDISCKTEKRKRKSYSIEKYGARCFGIYRFRKQHPNLNVG